MPSSYGKTSNYRLQRLWRRTSILKFLTTWIFPPSYFVSFSLLPFMYHTIGLLFYLNTCLKFSIENCTMDKQNKLFVSLLAIWLSKSRIFFNLLTIVKRIAGSFAFQELWSQTEGTMKKKKREERKWKN